MNLQELHSKLYKQRDALTSNLKDITRVEKFSSEARYMGYAGTLETHTADCVAAKCKNSLESLYNERIRLKNEYTTEYDRLWKLRKEILTAKRLTESTKEDKEIRDRLANVKNLLGDDLYFLLKHQDKL